MPDWRELARALCHPLYPTDDARRSNALQESSGTSGFLRLAQEYRAAFGHSALNDRIRSLVPDLDYKPSDLHRRLLRLPWADIFTTNWDTLLERACSDVFDRSYDVVRKPAEIPFTARPRIVKLHGTFPDHDPFIFTEEDYRTYPHRFSPFVNLVQQSMMETNFCLLGFSGDDPNFLHWSGWVRDNLGKNAPKIYLVGWLDLSVHRRRMLEERNVMPIDLSMLPAASSWPSDLRHSYATEWFLGALEMGRPYPATHWPAPAEPPAPTPPYLGPIPAPDFATPLAEPHRPGRNETVKERASRLLEAAAAWAYNRMIYPGWLVAPEGVRLRLRHSVQTWLDDVSTLSECNGVERLRVFSELAWLMDRALLPFPIEHEQAAFRALEAIDRVQKAVDGTRCPDPRAWRDLMNGAATLAIALAGNGRRDGDRPRFERAMNLLSRESSEIQNAAIYEECLWELAAGRLTELLARLDNWLPALGATTWSLRKAGLLAEMEDHTRACSLLETTLAHIRRTRRRDIDDLVSLSLESWALFLALAYSRDLPGDSPTLPRDIPEPFDRWRALGIVDCNAFSDFNSICRLLEAEDTSHRTITKTRGFDLDHHGVTRHFGGPSSTLIAAYQVVQLAEATGIPPSTRHVALLQDGLKSAARILASREPWLASQLTIRMASDNNLVDAVFSRANVARLPTSAVTLAAECLERRTAFNLERAGSNPKESRAGITTAGNAIEILSRIAVRLNDKDLLRLFERALDYYKSPTFRHHSMFLGRPIAHLVARILESISSRHIEILIIRLLSLPLPNEVGLSRDEYGWHDPAQLLPPWLRDFTWSDRSDLWNNTIPRLIAGVRSTNPTDRKAAVGRLLKLQEWKILTVEQSGQFASALWEQLDESELPSHTGLLRWVLLILPEVRSGQAVDALQRFAANQSKQRALSHLPEIAAIARHLKRLGLAEGLSLSVQSDLTATIGIWADSRRPRDSNLSMAFDRQVEQQNDIVEAVSVLLPFINVDAQLAERLWAKITGMDSGADGTSPGFRLYPFLLIRFPDRVGVLVDRLLRALLSDEEETVRAAVDGLFFLLRAPVDPGILTDHLESLVREVGLAIAARRTVILRPALNLARWLFEDGPEPLRQIIAHECDNGLKALFEEASYSRYDQTFDVPTIRSACILLAASMNRCGLSELTGVKAWLQAAEDDPLPEVRNALDRRFNSEQT
jgi:hypothetical protein